MTDLSTPCWCGKGDKGHDPEHDRQADVVSAFLDEALLEMAARMVEGLRRGWGTDYRDHYSDSRAKDRVANAELDFLMAFRQFRRGRADVAELRKRAADLANQVFMLADPERLEHDS